MKHRDGKCDPTLVSLYYDGELNAERADEVKAHIAVCPECAESLREMEVLSLRVNAHILDSEQTDLSAHTVTNTIVARIRDTSRTRWERIRSALLSRKVWIPAAAFASLALVFATVFRSPAVSGPSAIVTSLSGDTSSVIIMEVPDSGHTIVWFTEA